MRLIKKMTLWRLVLIIGVVVIAIPIVPRERVATNAQFDEDEEYWSRRVERKLDRRWEDLDRETGEDNEDADTKDNKDKKGAKNKDSKDAADDEDDADDPADRELERRREYWRQRLDREW